MGSHDQGWSGSWRRLAAAAGLVVALLLALGLTGVFAGDEEEERARPAGETAPRAPAPAATGRSPRFGSLRGTILSPPSASLLPPTFRSSLRITGSRDGRHVWLAVLLRLSVYFPQGGERELGEQSVEVAVGPGVGSFLLVLIAVDDADHQRILDWIRAGRATGARPGLELPSARHLDEVALVAGRGS